MEIELTKNFSNAKKYERVMNARKNGELKDIFSGAIGIVSICDTKPNAEGVKPIWIKTDWSNFSNLTYAIAGV